MNTNTESFTNYYSLFGLSEHATYEDIKKKYNALALAHHPDRNQGHETEFFQRIQQAWEVFRDPQQKKAYDAQLKDRHWLSTRR
jgi:molecular chaperone DnaJ